MKNVLILLVIITGLYLMNKNRWLFENFAKEEMKCKCGRCTALSGLNMNYSTMKRLQQLRERCGFPFHITSAYRCENHPVEKKKAEGGTHFLGHAVDIAATPQQMDIIEREARALGFTGIGRASTFIHIDDFAGSARINRPAKWSYA